MGRGGYLGGGTIVGPASRWSDHADFPVPENPPPEPDGAAVPARAGGGLTRYQRRKRARQRSDASVNTPAVQRQAAKPLTAQAQARINAHRMVIRSLDGQIARAMDERARERTQLRSLLQEHGLPTKELDEDKK